MSVASAAIYEAGKIYKVNSKKADFIFICSVQDYVIKYQNVQYPRRVFTTNPGFLATIVEGIGMTLEEFREDYPEYCV